MVVRHKFSLKKNAQHGSSIHWSGKKKEILREVRQSHEAEMVAVIGRRRVGKTFLIKNAHENQIVFSVSGELGTPLDEHLKK